MDQAGDRLSHRPSARSSVAAFDNDDDNDNDDDDIIYN
jgi:hypothetical protein